METNNISKILIPNSQPLQVSMVQGNQIFWMQSVSFLVSFHINFYFVGINSASRLRSNNLQGLIYKQGATGITKATVTAVFDNSNPAQSPLGYEKTPIITVARSINTRGQNKYLINGRSSTAQNVRNMFSSIGLNISNPTFLIMQGRITKVMVILVNSFLEYETQ